MSLICRLLSGTLGTRWTPYTLHGGAYGSHHNFPEIPLDRKIHEIETDRNGDFMFDIGAVDPRSKTHIFEMRVKRWGDIALAKIKCSTESGEWNVSEMPLK